MYHKGIILEVKKDYCLVLCDDGTVSRIKYKEGVEEGQKIFYLDEDIYVKKEENRNNGVLPFKGTEKKDVRKNMAMKAAAVAAAVILVLGTFGFNHYENQVYAAVSIDGGESIQLELNKKGKVVSAVSYGDKISEEELRIYKGMTIEEVWNFFTRGHKGEKVYIVGYVAIKGDDSTEDMVLSGLKNTVKDKNVLYLKGNECDLDKAAEENISLGKYIASQYPDDDDFEDFLEHSSKESILKYIEKNKDKISKKEAEALLKAKDRYDKENADDDEDDDDDDDDDKVSKPEKHKKPVLSRPSEHKEEQKKDDGKKDEEVRGDRPVKENEKDHEDEDDDEEEEEDDEEEDEVKQEK